jgi:hypothetical protein
VYPNPANRSVQVEFNRAAAHPYRLIITNMSGQAIREVFFTPPLGSGIIPIERTPLMPDGIYHLTIQDMETGEMRGEKVIFSRQAP